MKKLLILAMFVALSTLAFSQATFVTGDRLGKHAIVTTTGWDGGCMACHIPHNTAANEFLWARAAQIQVPDHDGTNSDFSGAAGNNPAFGAAAWGSYSCLTCHDGVTSPTIINASNQAAIAYNGNISATLGSTVFAGALANPYDPAATGTASMTGNAGLGLKNDHPVHVVLSQKRLDRIAAATSKVSVVYEGTTPYMECTTCHDQHAGTAKYFLRVNADDGGLILCRNCHGS